MMENGVYKFAAEKLPRAHAECLKKYTELVRSTRDRIIVDNTNIRVYEIAPYYQLASAYGHQARIVTLKVPGEIAFARNIHDVTEAAFAGMARDLEEETKRFPPWWTHEVVL